MKTKIYDSVILIRLLDETDFSEIFEKWDNNGEYKQVTTWECVREVKGGAEYKLKSLISKDVIEILKPVPIVELVSLFSAYRNISFVDCSVLYYSIKIEDSICLTDDFPLRKHHHNQDLECHGTCGIYQKLLKDQSFSSDLIEEKFRRFMSDARVFPING